MRSFVHDDQNAVSGRNLEALVKVRDLSVEFATDRGWTRVVNQINLDLYPGRIHGLVGESGSGKSVTSLAMMHLLPPKGSRIATGFIEFAGRDLAHMSEREMTKIRGKEMSMIFQEPMTSLNPAFTIGEQIAETIRRHYGVKRSEAWSRAVKALDDVGIPNAAQRAKKYPYEFSGGMRQRAMIAMAISCEPKLLIADEPTTALDVTIQDQILRLLREMCESRDLALMFITHDMGVVSDLCDEVTVMYVGQTVESGDVFQTFENPLHPYTEGLLHSIPTLSGGNELSSIPGGPPMPWNLPQGCRFNPRCPYAEERCCSEEIQMIQLGNRSVRCIRPGDTRGGAN
jgi:oligopeptide/dipeptide ABC transporter ATP-binding protein